MNKDAALKRPKMSCSFLKNLPWMKAELTFVVAALQITGVAVKAWKSRMENTVNDAVDVQCVKLSPTDKSAVVTQCRMQGRACRHIVSNSSRSLLQPRSRSIGSCQVSKTTLGWFCNHFTYHPYMDIDHVKLEDVRACSSSLLDFNVRIHCNKKTSTAPYISKWYRFVKHFTSCSVWFVKHHLVHQNKSLHKNDLFMKFTSLT